MNEYTLFFRRWLKAPRNVGTWAPIGYGLARLAVSSISHRARVVEIGAGTGRLTRELLAHGVHPDRLVAVEWDEAYHEFLVSRCPSVSHTIRGDAAQLPYIIPQSWVGTTDVILSAIPLLYLSPLQRDAIIDAALSVLTPDGVIIHVTYCPWSHMRHRSDLIQTRLSQRWLHMPPGFVWTFQRKSLVSP
jgi:phosphatidylethanolamine/phosphatidyl-N-methylethanolamine N-methyltransferase